MSFTAFPLDKLGLPADKVQLLHRSNYVNASDVLLAPLSDICRKLRLKHSDAQALVRDVSKAVVPRTSVLSALVGGPAGGLGKRKRGNGREGVSGPGAASAGEGCMRTGDEGLDVLLGGGLRVGSVTEIVGERRVFLFGAAGKSHFCLHLALSCQLPSLTSPPGGAIILTSERELSTTRLAQLGQVMARRHGSHVFLKRDSLSDGVLTRRVKDVDELDLALSHWVPAFLERGRAVAATAGDVPADKRKSGGNWGRWGRLMGYGGAEPEGDEEADDQNTKKADPSAQAGDGIRDGNTGTNRPNSSSTGPATTPGPPPHSVSASFEPPARPRAPNFRPLPFPRPPPKTTPIRLLILDSLTALLRGADTAYSSSSAGLTARSRHLCLVADKLKALAVEYELAVVVVNQVSDVFERKSYPAPKPVPADEEDTTAASASAAAAGGSGSGPASRLPPSQPGTPGAYSGGTLRPSQPGGAHASSSQSLSYDQAWYASGPDPPMLYSTQSRWFSGQSSARTKEAALGVVWANAVNTRIMLSRTGRRRVLKQAEVEEMARGTKLGDILGQGASQALGEGEVHWGTEGAVGVGEGEEGAIGAETARTLIRKAHVVFSPFAPAASVDFVLRGTGLHGLRDTYALEEDGASILARARKRRDGDGGGNDVGGEGPETETEKEGGDEGYDDLFGGMQGLEEVPDEWWAGRVEGDAEPGPDVG